jgi:signal transduction histidine kinase
MKQHNIKITFYLFSLLAILSCNYKKTDKNDVFFKSTFSKYERNRNGDLDSLIKCLKQVDSLYTNNQDCRFAWLSNQIKGNLFSRISEYKTAREYYLKAQKAINLRTDLDSLIAKSEIGIAQTFKNTGNYPEAIKSNLKALAIFERYNLISSANKTKANIANIYMLKGDFNQAKQSLKNIVKNNFIAENAIALHTLANVYGELGEIDSALFIDNTMITNLSNNKYKLLLSPFYNNKALCLLSLKKNDSALIFLNKSFEIDSIKNDQKNMGANLISLAEIYTENGNHNLALEKLKIAYSIFKKHDIKRELKNCYNQLSIFFKNKGDYKTAMLYGDSANVITQQIDNLSLNTKIELLQIEYETQKKDALIEKQKQKINKQQILGIIIFLIIILSLSTLYFIFKSKQNKLKFYQQQTLNEAIYDTEISERERIARDLHDSIGQKLSVVKMQLSMKNADTQSAINLLDEAIQDVRNVSHNLMPADLSKGLITAIENMSEQMNLPSNTLQVHLHITNNARLLVINKQQSMLIYRIIQELLNNAIKYAQAKNIHINMDCEKNQLKLILTDDGVGFDLESIIKNGGLGIKNIKERVHYMIGDLQFDSKIGQGTQYQISIPI